MGAVELLRARGAPKVFVMGASLGARACLWAASRPGVTLGGVIGISMPKNAVAAYQPAYDFTAEVIGAIHAPIMFVAGDQDERYAAEATVMYGWANAPKKLSIVSSAVHGAGLLQDPTVSSAVLATCATTADCGSTPHSCEGPGSPARSASWPMPSAVFLRLPRGLPPS